MLPKVTIDEEKGVYKDKDLFRFTFAGLGTTYNLTPAKSEDVSLLVRDSDEPEYRNARILFTHLYNQVVEDDKNLDVDLLHPDGIQIRKLALRRMEKAPTANVSSMTWVSIAMCYMIMDGLSFALLPRKLHRVPDLWGSRAFP